MGKWGNGKYLSNLSNWIITVNRAQHTEPPFRKLTENDFYVNTFTEIAEKNKSDVSIYFDKHCQELFKMAFRHAEQIPSP